MKETERIGKLFSALYNGHPWLDVTIMANLEKLPWQMAAEKVHPRLNTIWEIVNHMVSWRVNVLRRMNGDVIKTPLNNYFAPISVQSEETWLRSLDNLQASQEAWIDFLQNANDTMLETLYADTGMTYYEHLHGIVQHDAYHLGQIVLLVKMQTT